MYRFLYKSRVLFIMTCLYLPVLATGQISNDYPIKPNKQYFKSYLTLSKNVVTGPLRWHKKEWIIAGSTIAAGTVCYIYDDEIRSFFQKSQSEGADFTSEYILGPWGGITYPAILLGGYYLHGITTKNNKSRQIALAGTQAFIMSAVSTEVLKNVFHRHRPTDIPPDPRAWEGPLKGWGEYNSFPSRHAAIAFSLATVISDSYPEKAWVSILSYSLATGVAISRVYDDEHWASDAIIGAALGYAIGKSVTFLMKNDKQISMGITGYGGLSVVCHL